MATGDLVDRVMRYENGDMDQNEIVSFFGELVRSGLAWQLQGSYGRTAVALIKNGQLSQSGEVLN